MLGQTLDSALAIAWIIYLYVGRFKKYWLAMFTGGQQDNEEYPKKHGSTIQDSYKVAVVNSNNVLGAGYDFVCSRQRKTKP